MKINNLIYNIIFYFYVLITILYYYNNSMYINYLSYVIGTLLIGFHYSAINQRVNKKIVFVIFVLSFFMLAAALYTEGLLLSAFGVLLILLIGDTLIKSNVINLFPYITCIISLHYIVYILSGGFTFDYFPVKSHNHLSVLIISCSILAIYFEQSQKKLNWMLLASIFLGLVATYMAVGRSGIISMSVLFLGYVILEFKNFNQYRRVEKVYLSSIFITIVLTLIYTIISFSLNEYFDFRKFEQAGFESDARENIIKLYIENIDVGSFLFGVDPTIIRNTLDLSLHNSYLSLHSVFGLGSLLIFAMMGYTVFKLIKTNVGYAIIYISLLLRAFTDSILFNSSELSGIIIVLFYLHILYEKN